MISRNSQDSSSSDVSDTSAHVSTPTHKTRTNMLGRGLACVRCRTRKQRCDGAQPSCSTCVGANKSCEYVLMNKPRRKPQIPATEALASKLAQLESNYAALLQASSSNGGPSSVAAAACGISRLSTSPTLSNLSVGSLPGDMPPEFYDHPSMVDEMSFEDRCKVIRIFFTGSQRLGCPILPSRFFERLAHPDKRKRPHAALINGMLLCGVAFTSWTPGYSTAKRIDLPPSTPSEEVLLTRTRAYLDRALAQCDRMLDLLQASILVSYYFFQKGRLQEGQVISAANSRLAVTCNLHRIDNAVLDEMRQGNVAPLGHSRWDGTLLGRPDDSYELGVRIWTFWQAWYYDAVFSIVSGTPLARDPELPTTVFPRPSATYESGLAFSLRNTSFRELYDNNPPQFSSPDDEPEGSSHPLATYLKGLAIMERTNQLLVRVNAGLPLEDSSMSSATLHNLHCSLQCLLREYLPVQRKDQMSNAPLAKAEACKIYCALAERIVGHVFLHTATIQLCRLSRVVIDGSHTGRVEALASIRSLELDAARGAARALRLFGDEVRKLDNRMKGFCEDINTSVIAEVQEHPCLLLGFLLTSVSMVLVDHIHNLQMYPEAALNTNEVMQYEDDLRICVNTIERTATAFPLLGVQVQKIYDYKARATMAVLGTEPRWEFERRASIVDYGSSVSWN